MYYVTLTHDGIARDYVCNTYFDAVVLQDALIRVYGADKVSNVIQLIDTPF